jgi:hypothetical protein
MRNILILALIGIAISPVAFSAEECFSKEEIAEIQKPPELLKNFVNCARNKKLEEAVYSYLTSKVYGYYDTLRVKDETAHQVMPTLLFAAGGAEGIHADEVNDFNEFVITHGTKENEAYCKFLNSLDEPNYYPVYMIMHGMEYIQVAMEGKKLSVDPIVEGFDSKKAWEEARGKIGLCQ